MFLTDLSIKRPVFATVLSLVLVLFGIVTFNKIVKRQFEISFFMSNFNFSLWKVGLFFYIKKSIFYA